MTYNMCPCITYGDNLQFQDMRYTNLFFTDYSDRLIGTLNKFYTQFSHSICNKEMWPENTLRISTAADKADYASVAGYAISSRTAQSFIAKNLQTVVPSGTRNVIIEIYFARCTAVSQLAHMLNKS
uniref:Uncharacterized protein n=1 Tax=Glossina austeni TaxID=7395 RepID=A0A1A9VEY0_GLOAU